MAEGAASPNVFTIAPHRPFADALAAGLAERFGGEPDALARGLVLLPSGRAVRAIRDAFVRRAGAGLLLPRLVALGEEALDEAIGPTLDPLGHDAPLPPAIDPLERRMILARLVAEARAASGRPVDAAEAVRLAGDLARVRDQLLIERVDPARLADAVAEELSGHWQISLAELAVILDRWPAELKARGRIDLADRRDRLFDRAAARWRANPPADFVVAAGIAIAAPALAALLRTVSRLPNGMVVFHGLDRAMPEPAWTALGPHDPDPATDRARPSIETHPQFALKLLLDRMGVARGEVARWRGAGGVSAPAARTRAIGNAMLPAAFTGLWQGLKPAYRRLGGIRAAIFANLAEEAQAIALALRESVEQPGRTAALVTPDRGLARRVSAHLRRWGIEADDSAGRPLSATPPGALVLALAEVAAERFAPVPLLALLKHPLAAAGEGRLGWLDKVRRLDRALRGPRPPARLAGLSAWLASGEDRERALREPVRAWWEMVAAMLAPLEEAVAAGDLAGIVAALRETLAALTGDVAWAGVDGRALADLILRLEASIAPATLVDASAVAPLLRTLTDEIAVRPPQGGHPRIFIWGLIEARLQRVDLTILGGLNEGTWPALPAPDPWLAPRIRADLGLPGLERRIGVNAHDFAMALGGGQVIVTRARRGESGPTTASRFLLRLEAMTGGVTRAPRLARWVDAIDRPAGYAPADRPAPNPPSEARPRRIAVTSVDRLKADPFAFYARSILRLSPLDPVDADPGPAWRGQQVHKLLEDWFRADRADPATLHARAEALLAGDAAHPLVRALWQPRLTEAIAWIADEMAKGLAEGRRPVAAEIRGEIKLAGVRLNGTADRIDRLADNGLAIVDYKTGAPPANSAVAAGYAMQLGLLGLIAARGGFADIAGEPEAFEYWSLAKGRNGAFGYVARPADDRAKGAIPIADFPARAAQVFAEAAGRWLTGDAPFTAKLHPEYAPYGEYDQLMRLDEWYGREDAPPAASLPLP